jgi:diguanylate cyclase (GGDEF)-like protein/PAS domain S-box-containing protein
MCRSPEQRDHRRNPNEIAMAPSRRPVGHNERLLSEVSRLNSAVEALEKQCALRQALIDASPDHLWVKDVDGGYVVVNKALASDLDRSKISDLIGVTDFDVRAPESASRSSAIEQNILRSGQPVIDREESVVSLSGATKRLALTITPLCGIDGKVVALVGVGRDVTELKAARGAASERQSVQALIDQLPDNLWIKDVKSRFIIANQATAERIHLARPADLVGKTDFELLPAALAQKFYVDEQQVVQSGQPMIDMEEYVFDGSGGKTWVLTTKVALRNDSGEIYGVAGVSRDITERKLADALRDGQAKILEMVAMSAPLRDVLEHLALLVESQLTGTICSILLRGDAGTRLRLGAAPSLPDSYAKAIEQMTIGPNAGPSGAAAYRRQTITVTDITTDPLWEDHRSLAAEYDFRSVWSTPILSHQGEAVGIFATYAKRPRRPTDAETRLVNVATRIAGIAIERKLAEDRIQFMANHDALTGLPNRILLNDRLSQALLYAQRYDRWVTVLFVDLDNFKLVNDSLGHNAGDELLKTVADRMVKRVRATDTVVRLGGDEFVIVLNDQPKSTDVISAEARKILTAIAEPVRLEGRDLRVTSSLGVATYPHDGIDADTLLANADAAMYRAKDAGRDNFQVYTPEMNAKVHEKLLLQEELRNAVARSEFVLHYQPQVDLRTGRVFAVEALVRWNHPRLGMVPPLKFIPKAETTGLIVPIGDWVLREACRQNKAWQDAGLPPMVVGVNVSARQFREKDLLAGVATALRESGLEARFLELEVTESLIMQDVDVAVATMKALQDLGVQLSIDDFGTGFSSLSALKTFPVSRLKLDRSFVHDLPHDESGKAVATAVIALGQTLNLRVIAEGVETDEQLEFLRENNCDEMQGYLFSKPVPPSEIADLIKRHWALTTPQPRRAS